MNNKISKINNRVLKLYKKHDSSAISIGLVLAHLTDIINDGDDGVSWKSEFDAISFSDYCRQIGFENRLEYRYRNAGKLLIEDRSDFIENYKLKDDIEYLPSYTILDRIYSLKSKLKKIKGGWDIILKLVFEDKVSVNVVGMKCKELLNKNDDDSGNKSSKTFTDTNELDENIIELQEIKYDENVEMSDNSFRIDSKNSAILLIEFHEKLLEILPNEIDVELFEFKFEELSKLFNIDINLAA